MAPSRAKCASSSEVAEGPSFEGRTTRLLALCVTGQVAPAYGRGRTIAFRRRWASGQLPRSDISARPPLLMRSAHDSPNR